MRPGYSRNIIFLQCQILSIRIVENISKISKGTLSFVTVTGLLYEERNFTLF